MAGTGRRGVRHVPDSAGYHRKRRSSRHCRGLWHGRCDHTVDHHLLRGEQHRDAARTRRRGGCLRSQAHVHGRAGRLHSQRSGDRAVPRPRGGIRPAGSAIGRQRTSDSARACRSDATLSRRLQGPRSGDHGRLGNSGYDHRLAGRRFPGGRVWMAGDIPGTRPAVLGGHRVFGRAAARAGPDRTETPDSTSAAPRFCPLRSRL